MLEEIADSMTTGGVIAAAVGLGVVLAILVLRVRERNGGEREAERTPGNRDGVPGTRADGPVPAADMPPATEMAAAPAARPASVFKPYVPPARSPDVD